MPLRTYATRADFDEAYDIGTGWFGPLGEVRLHYHRAVLRDEAGRRAQALVSALGITATDATVIVGCGFGWTVEAWPHPSVVGVDTSAYVHDAKAGSETQEIRDAITAAGLDPDRDKGAEALAALDDGGSRARVVVIEEDINLGRAKKTISDALGTRSVDWAISESVIESLEDTEATDLGAAMGKVATNCAHLVDVDMTVNELSFNRKSASEWRALFDRAGLTGHRLVAAGSYRVF